MPLPGDVPSGTSAAGRWAGVDPSAGRASATVADGGYAAAARGVPICIHASPSAGPIRRRRRTSFRCSNSARVTSRRTVNRATAGSLSHREVARTYRIADRYSRRYRQPVGSCRGTLTVVRAIGSAGGDALEDIGEGRLWGGGGLNTEFFERPD
jgi:hypothetical protein